MHTLRSEHRESMPMFGAGSVHVEFWVDSVLRFTAKGWDKSESGLKVLHKGEFPILKVGTWGELVLTFNDSQTRVWGEVVWIDPSFKSTWVGFKTMPK